VKVSIVMGIDQHRAQITAEWIELESGEIGRARVRPADRAGVRRFLARFAGQQLEVATEATTGWRFLVEELRAAGARVHLAEPAETAALRGNKKRAKSDRADARHLRELLLAGRVPESWIPPDDILDLRARVRLRHTLIEAHREYQQRIQAVLYHHGCPRRRGLMVGDGRDWLAGQPLPETAREQIMVALAMIDVLEVQIAPIDRELRAYARAQTGCKALIDAYYGIGELCAVTIVSELGDCRRFSNSRDAVRYGGMDITVYQSDRHRAPGHLSRQGPPALRWALYEAAQVARRPTSPDRAYYEQAAKHLGGNRACLALARKLLKRCYHTLRELGDDALAPPALQQTARARSTAARPPATLRASKRPAKQRASACAGPPEPAFNCATWQLAQNPGTGKHQLRHPCARQVLTHTDAPRPAP
jgi:transposase